MTQQLLPTQRGATITFEGMAEQEFQVWIEDITSCVNGLEAASAVAQWGSIVGNIESQADLVSFVADNFTIDSTITSDATISVDRGEYNPSLFR